MKDRFVGKREVCQITSLSKATIDRKEAEGLFPERVRLGGYPNSRVAWRLSKLEKWMANPT